MALGRRRLVHVMLPRESIALSLVWSAQGSMAAPTRPEQASIAHCDDTTSPPSAILSSPAPHPSTSQSAPLFERVSQSRPPRPACLLSRAWRARALHLHALVTSPSPASCLRRLSDRRPLGPRRPLPPAAGRSSARNPPLPRYRSTSSSPTPAARKPHLCQPSLTAGPGGPLLEPASHTKARISRLLRRLYLCAGTAHAPPRGPHLLSTPATTAANRIARLAEPRGRRP
jgi:hypothetical protein